MADEREPDAVVDLFGGTGTGPLWGMASSDLNATLLAWSPGHELVEDTNSELDVLLIVLEGGGSPRSTSGSTRLFPAVRCWLRKGAQGRSVRARTASATSLFIDAGGPCRSPSYPRGADREWTHLPSSVSGGHG
jgi:hypothetical protein